MTLQYSSLNENECMNKQKDLVFDISIGNIQNSKTLNEVYKSFKVCVKHELSALNVCKEIECLIIDLQEVDDGY